MRSQQPRLSIPALRIPRSTLAPPLMDALLPSSTTLAHALAAAAFVALIAASAQVRIFLPDTPVPITLQSFGVILAGGVLGWRWGVIALLTYYLIGIAGAPVFAQANSGWDYASAATGGYLIGFILAAAIAGLATQLGARRWEALWAMLAASATIYIPGLIWLSFALPPDASVLSAGLYPFIPGDLIKIAAAGLALGGLWKIADRRSTR